MADLWVFGYGSLMWRPGFSYVERSPARLEGYHRSLCIYSHFHRGNAEHPGLVLGLDLGGHCRGMAFRVTAADADAVLAYLRERELVTHVYQEIIHAIALEDGSHRQVEALTYVVDRSHAQYAGVLDIETQLRFVRQGHGQSGPNADYVKNTVAAIEELGLTDNSLHRLAELL